MGLDTTHGCWSGPYSAFNRFRYSLAYQIGINLDEYAGYNDLGVKNLSDIKHPLMPLFNHSDCDGRLTVKECKSIVKGLNNVLENFTENEKYDFDFKEKIKQFRDGCEHAISLKQMVKFH